VLAARCQQRRQEVKCKHQEQSHCVPQCARTCLVSSQKQQQYRPRKTYRSNQGTRRDHSRSADRGQRLRIQASPQRCRLAAVRTRTFASKVFAGHLQGTAAALAVTFGVFSRGAHRVCALTCARSKGVLRHRAAVASINRCDAVNSLPEGFHADGLPFANGGVGGWRRGRVGAKKRFLTRWLADVTPLGRVRPA
jgi:hypothetical protein